MHKRMTWSAAFGAAVLAFGLVGCGDPVDDANPANSGPGGKGDETNSQAGPAACEGQVTDHSGRQLAAGFERNLNDPFAKKVLQPGDSCPTTFGDVMAKMRETDAAGCEDDPRKGIESYFVSEATQVHMEDHGYRIVVTRRCDNRKEEDLFFSLFGASGGEVPQRGAEVMAFDEVNGVYNYYRQEGSGWAFHGSSKDFLLAGDGQGPECAACHGEGGAVMKELHTPWQSWDSSHIDLPGIDAYVDADEDLGRDSDGASFESLIKSANRRYNDSRVAMIKAEGSVKQMLEPLFCTNQINFDNGSDFPRAEPVDVGADFLLDPVLFRTFGGPSVKQEVYEKVLADIGQFMSDDHSKQGNSKLTDAEGKVVVDTPMRFFYPERAEITKDYVEKLQQAGHIDEDFVRDVLSVDFSRPIFSEKRCGLLQFAPEAQAAEMSIEDIRNAFIANLEGAGMDETAATFKAKLEDAMDAEANKKLAEDYFNACKARAEADEEGFMLDAMKYLSVLRDQVRFMHIAESPLLFPFDELDLPQTGHLDPTTCTWRDE